jgi:O-antigen/teichoic acid export membrane protein
MLKINKNIFISVFYAGSGAVSKAILFFTSILLAKSFSKPEYAVFNILYAIHIGVATFAMAGTAEALIGLVPTRKSERFKQTMYSLINGYIILNLLLMSFLGICASNLFLDLRELGFIGLVFASLSGVLISIFNYQSNIQRIQERHLKSLLFSTVAPALAAASAAVAASLFNTANAYFCGHAIIGAVVFSLLLINKTGVFSIKMQIRWLKVIFSIVWPHQFTSVLTWLSGYGMIWIVQLCYAKVDVAEFSLTYTLSSALQLVSNSMNQVWNPRFYNSFYAGQKSELEVENKKYFIRLGTVLGIAAAAIILSVKLLKKYGGGNLNDYSVQPGLAFFLAAYCFCIPWWHAQNYFLVERQGRSLMLIVLFSNIFGFFVWYIIVVKYGQGTLYFGFPLLMLIRSATASAFAWLKWKLYPAWEGVAIGVTIIILSAFYLR